MHITQMLEYRLVHGTRKSKLIIGVVGIYHVGKVLMRESLKNNRRDIRDTSLAIITIKYSTHRPTHSVARSNFILDIVEQERYGITRHHA